MPFGLKSHSVTDLSDDWIALMDNLQSRPGKGGRFVPLTLLSTLRIMGLN